MPRQTGHLVQASKSRVNQRVTKLKTTKLKDQIDPKSAGIVASLVLHSEVTIQSHLTKRVSRSVVLLVKMARTGRLNSDIMSVLGKEAGRTFIEEVVPKLPKRKTGVIELTDISKHPVPPRGLVSVRLKLKQQGGTSSSRNTIKHQAAQTSALSEHTPESTPRKTVSTKIITEFDASDRDELAAIAASIGMQVFGYGQPDRWVLASKLVRPDESQPAFVQITRTRGSNPKRFQLSKAWIGAEPNASGELRVLESAINNKPHVGVGSGKPLAADVSGPEAAVAAIDLDADQ